MATITASPGLMKEKATMYYGHHNYKNVTALITPNPRKTSYKKAVPKHYFNISMTFL